MVQQVKYFHPSTRIPSTRVNGSKSSPCTPQLEMAGISRASWLALGLVWSCSVSKVETDGGRATSSPIYINTLKIAKS